MSHEDADALVERLEDAWPERIQKPIRDAMRAHPEDPVEQVRAIVARGGGARAGAVTAARAFPADHGGRRAPGLLACDRFQRRDG